MELQINTLSTENKKLMEKMNDMDAYSRPWNLKISRVPKCEGDNVKMTVIDRFSCSHKLSSKDSGYRPQTVSTDEEGTAALHHTSVLLLSTQRSSLGRH